MRFKARALTLAGLTVALGGCGLFGTKNDPSSILTYQTPNGGCLDNIAEQVDLFAVGKISQAELNGGWNCASGSLTLFTQFIRGSVPNGYTPQDIQLFVSHFLFSKSQISTPLVQSMFALKATLFGGSADVLTIDEINQVLPFISAMQNQSLILLPLLRDRVENPTPANLLRLSRAIRMSGKTLAAALNTSANLSLTSDQIQALIAGIQSITAPTTVLNPQAGQLIVAIKQLLVGGSGVGIEGSAWPALLESLAGYLGPALSALSYQSAFAKGANAQEGFFTQLAGDFAKALNSTIAVNGGSIPFVITSQVIQNLPETVVSAARKSAVIGAQGMIFSHLLQSQTPNGIDKNVSAFLTSQVAFWDKIQSMINTIYDHNGYDTVAGASAGQIMTGLQAYSNNAADQAAVQWIVSLLQNYEPYFVGNDSEITLPSTGNYSLNDMTTKHLIRLISTVLLNGYSTGTDKTQIDFTDFSQFVDDLEPVLAAWQMADLTIPNPAKQRFLQASLFMPSSRGATTINLDEGSQYILYFLSVYSQTQKVETLVNAQCSSYGTDPFGTPLMNAGCFRKNYFANYLTFWDHMPKMTAYYQSLNSADQQTLESSLETAAREFGYSDQCVGFYDAEGFGGMIDYMETILERFDLTGSGVLDTNEALLAFPVFQNELITAGASSGLSATNVGEQQAAFTYALAHGALPSSGFVGEVDFLWWWLVVGQSGWNVQAQRNQLYQVIAGISAPPTPSSPTQCP